MGNKYIALKENLIRHLPAIVFVYCVLQPILDVASYWQTELEINNTITVLLRMGLLGGSVLLGFILSDRKRYYWIMAAVLGTFLVARTLACIEAGYPDPVEDLIYLFRVYFLPLTTLCFCTFLRQNCRVLRAIQWGMAVNMAVIAAVMAISRLTHTDPFTYTSTWVGCRGWFLYGNTQSAILGMLVPVCIGWALNKWERKILPVLAVCIVSMGALYQFGTRLAFASLVAAGIGMGICLILIDKKRFRQALAIICVALVFTAMLPMSPMSRNLNRSAGNLQLKQDAIEDKLDDEDKETDIEDVYFLFIPGLVTRFGAERTMKEYDYTTDAAVLSNWRKMRLTFCRMLLEDSPESAKWLGMSVTRMREKVMMKDGKGGKSLQWLYFDPENDFHGIYYVCGAVGLALMLAFILFFLVQSLYAMFRDFRRHFTVDFAAGAIGCCTALAHCVFTASTLRFNSAGFYLAVLLAVMWSLSRRERSAKRMKKMKG